MKRPVDSLHFREEDRQLLSIAELSQQARLSQAFIRLCLEAGCPAPRGLLSQAQLIDWLVVHYPSVRALAGLEPMPELESLPARDKTRRHMAFAIITLLEFSESRSSCRPEKEQLHWIRTAIEASLENE